MTDYPLHAVALHEAPLRIRGCAAEDEEGEGEEVGEGGEGVSVDFKLGSGWSLGQSLELGVQIIYRQRWEFGGLGG
ncbi:hypothetical protein V494_01431 [Pseudogymnoascus sp. VKM F-4513 (FW-928)]|nr:hypothetical protein V494_01431 [Pseudogymnoascus sp. VKM F-4513 (FW-928)]